MNNYLNIFGFFMWAMLGVLLVSVMVNAKTKDGNWHYRYLAYIVVWLAALSLWIWTADYALRGEDDCNPIYHSGCGDTDHNGQTHQGLEELELEVAVMQHMGLLQ